MRTQARWANVPNRGPNMTFVDQEFSPSSGASLMDEIPMAFTFDPAAGFVYFEDFLGVICDSNGLIQGWAYSSDTANTAATTPAGVVGGILNLATGGVDNNESYIQLGSATFEPFKITDNSGDPVWFKARVKSLQHADEAVFVGLAEAGCAAGNFLADNTGVPADKDYIGFRYKTDASAEWDVAWKKNGQAEQEAANVVANTDDWHTFEFRFDGLHTVTFYVDGTAVGTTATTSAATFPSGEEMSPIIAIKTGAAAARNVQVDYIKVAQAR